MQLSNATIQLLQNFKTINSHLVIEPGNRLSTISDGLNIIATSEVAETFPTKIGIYDLAEFLTVLGLVSDPQIEITEQFATISDLAGRVKVKYFFSSPENLTTPKKLIDMPAPEVTFALDQNTLNSLKRAAGAFGMTTVSITGTHNLITLSIVDEENSTSNQFSIDVPGSAKSTDFNFIVDITNLRLLPADYEVAISSRRISSFKSTNLEKQVTYWIALEKSSRYAA